MTPASVPTPMTELTHGCVRCGNPVPLHVAMCELCNPLGLSQPATSQAHGTVFVGIVIAVVALAVVARMAISGVGPFRATIAAAMSAPPNLALTLTVTNEGTRAGRTTCRVSDPTAPLDGEYGVIQTPRIEPGATVTFDATVTGLGRDVRPLTVDCRTP